MQKRILATLVAITLAGSLQSARSWEPGVNQPDAIGSPSVPLVVDFNDRNDVISFYQCIYKSSNGFAPRMNWNGNVDTCSPGTTAGAFKNDVRRRVNWFRAMSGIPADIVFSNEFNSDAQAAALIMSDEGALSHTPGASFGTGGCWTQGGDDAAGNGNLALGNYGPDAIDAYIEDSGGNNLAVGHRRWILFPRVTTMGTGDIPASGTWPYTDLGEHWASNCLYVIDSPTYRSSTNTFVTWPPAGNVPSATTWPRWSLSYSTTNFGYPRFSSATVTMTLLATGANIPTTIIYRYTGGGLAGDPTIAWEPNWSALGGTPPLESPIEITVSGITSGTSSAPGSHTYTVTVIDAENITDPVTISGSTTPAPTGSNYSFTQLTGVGADGYELGVSVKSSASWTEGAENSPTPEVIDGTSSGYDLRTNLTSLYGSPGNHTGSRVFHLAIPSFSEVVQTFEIDRALIPTATSRLQFQELFRWVTTSSHLSAQVSTNDGGSWTEVWGRDGNGATSTANWLKQWSARDVSLASYADQPIRIRFHYTTSGSAFIGTDNDYGVFVDEVTVTNSQELGAEHITALAGTASGFTLNSASAGGTLTVGEEFVLRVRPILGCKTFAFGAPMEVTITNPPPGFDAWMAANHPSVTPSGANDDPDGDNLPSGVEYALGTDPGNPDAGVPAVQIVGNQISLSIDTSALGYVPTGVTYGAEYSDDLTNWNPLPDSGSGSVHTFEVPTGELRRFGRWVISIAP